MDKIIHGDSLDVLKTLEADSVDLCVTDPPYGIAFMGRAWDRALPDIGIFKETLRVLKPGAFAFVMSAPRSDVCSRMALLLEAAGFNIAFTPIYWTYASGFPKSMNIGKMVDKRNGRDQDTYKPFAEYLKERRKAAGLSMKAIDDAFGTNTAYSWWEGRSSGIQLPSMAYYLQLKQLLSLDSRFDQLIEREEAAREVVGTRKVPAGHAFAGEVYDTANGEKEFNDTIAATDAAKALDGSYGGFQPKPAVEVVIVAMKPLSEKTYVDQALKNGKGITWLDDCRVPIGEETVPRLNKEYERKGGKNFGDGEDGRLGTVTGHESQGRFPANLLVSDDVLNDGKVRKSGAVKPYKEKHINVSSYGFEREKTYESAANSGSYSRFFSLDAWAQTLPFLAVPKASKSEKLGTAHPTTKPLKLMAYLIQLGSRPGDLVCDPFAGSGSTCVAAKQLGRNFIGIEREREYCDMAELRLAAVQPTLLNKQ